MSRCFPYPPPGYTLSKAREEALIDLIKLQKEKQRKKEEKEKKKERKEEKQRKKEGEEKKKERKEGEQSKGEKEKKQRKNEKKDKPNPNLDNSGIVKAYVVCSDKGDSVQKKREDETEQLERSSLTEEHGNPARLPVPSSSSDSTENSNKRKRDSSPIGNFTTKFPVPLSTHGCETAKAVLIRLPSKKQNELDASAKEQLLCSTSGRTGVPARNGVQNFCCTLVGTSKQGGTKSVRNAVVTPIQRMALKYRNLFENMVPPWYQDRCLSPENLDWLFPDKNQDTRAEKRQKSGSDSLSSSLSLAKSRIDSLSCSRNSCFWPRAEYLHEIDAYAMPYTIPY